MLQNDKTTNATSSSEFLIEMEQKTKIMIYKCAIKATYVVQFILTFQMRKFIAVARKATSKTKT